MRHFIYAAILALMAVGALSQDWESRDDSYTLSDYETALQEWRRLAEQGEAAAQYSLGVTYSEGKGVTQDYAKAVHWYRLATERGYTGCTTSGLNPTFGTLDFWRR